MNIDVTFPGGKRVDAAFEGFVVHTDQSPMHGGKGAAPEPYELFLASLATCAGAYVLAFCDARQIATSEIRLAQRGEFDGATGRLERVEIEISLPSDFPDKYRAPLLRAVESCKVKRTLASPPVMSVGIRGEAAPPVSSTG
jgi:putative redox protein